MSCLYIYIYIYIYIYVTHKRGMDWLFINMNISRERYRFFVYRCAHIQKGGWYLYTCRRVSRRNGQSGYQHINPCAWRFYLQCWICCSSPLVMTPRQQAGSRSYVTNAAAPYPAHTRFAFVLLLVQSQSYTQHHLPCCCNQIRVKEMQRGEKSSTWEPQILKF